jgi:hypothetical protein
LSTYRVIFKKVTLALIRFFHGSPWSRIEIGLFFSVSI